MKHPVTPDGRYFVVRGRLWRMSDPRLDKNEQAAWTSALMTARRAVGVALRAGDTVALKVARADVDAAKIKLGERGPVWWDDGSPDENRKMAKNSSYAAWWAGIATG